jgi:hypothetical protein
MNRDDALKLLAVGISLDPRLKGGTGDDPDEMLLKAATWSGTLDNDMPLSFAVETMRAHYSNNEQMIMPGHLNSRWRTQSRKTQHTDSHCGITGCVCVHRDGCYKGWIDNDYGTTKPCPTCRPIVAERLASRT